MDFVELFFILLAQIAFRNNFPSAHQRQFPLECLFLVFWRSPISSLSVTLNHIQLRELPLLNLKKNGRQTVEFFSKLSNYKQTTRTFFIVEVF